MNFVEMEMFYTIIVLPLLQSCIQPSGTFNLNGVGVDMVNLRYIFVKQYNTILLYFSPAYMQCTCRVITLNICRSITSGKRGYMTIHNFFVYYNG